MESELNIFKDQELKVNCTICYDDGIIESKLKDDEICKCESGDNLLYELKQGIKDIRDGKGISLEELRKKLFKDKDHIY